MSLSVSQEELTKVISERPEIKRLSKLIVIASIFNLKDETLLQLVEERDETDKAIGDAMIRAYDKTFGKDNNLI